MTKIFVGNLSFDATESDVRAAFEAHGQVDSVSLITDRMSGRPKGFGFVEMSDDAAAQAAIGGLNETEMRAAPSPSTSPGPRAIAKR